MLQNMLYNSNIDLGSEYWEVVVLSCHTPSNSIVLPSDPDESPECELARFTIPDVPVYLPLFHLPKVI